MEIPGCQADAVPGFSIRSSRYFISPVKTKLRSPNSWLERDLSRWAKKISASDDHGAVHQDAAAHRRPFGPQVLQLDFVDELVAGHRLAVEHGLGDLGQHHLLAELVRLADQNAAGLGQAFQNKRPRHDRPAGEMVGEVFLGVAQVLHRPRRFAAFETP